MSTTAFTALFDTLAFAKELENAGFSQAQAEAQAKAFSSAMRQVEENRKDELATKRDLVETESKIIKWTAGMFAAQTALILGALFAAGKVGQPTTQQPVYQPPVQEMRVPAPVTTAQPQPYQGTNQTAPAQPQR